MHAYVLPVSLVIAALIPCAWCQINETNNHDYRRNNCSEVNFTGTFDPAARITLHPPTLCPIMTKNFSSLVNGLYSIHPCHPCQPGHHQVTLCGAHNDTVCEVCPSGTYNPVWSVRTQCSPCPTAPNCSGQAPAGTKLTDRPCTATTPPSCGVCPGGEYHYPDPDHGDPSQLCNRCDSFTDSSNYTGLCPANMFAARFCLDQQPPLCIPYIDPTLERSRPTANSNSRTNGIVTNSVTASSNASTVTKITTQPATLSPSSLSRDKLAGIIAGAVIFLIALMLLQSVCIWKRDLLRRWFKPMDSIDGEAQDHVEDRQPPSQDEQNNSIEEGTDDSLANRLPEIHSNWNQEGTNTVTYNDTSPNPIVIKPVVTTQNSFYTTAGKSPQEDLAVGENPEDRVEQYNADMASQRLGYRTTRV